MREYVLTYRIIPEALKGERRVEVTAKEVAVILNLENRYPLVIEALTNNKTKAYINHGLRELGLCLSDIKKKGPKVGPNTTVIYELGPCTEPGGTDTHVQARGVSHGRGRHQRTGLGASYRRT